MNKLDLNSMDVKEMNSIELRNNNGGFAGLEGSLLLLAGLLITEWETTKKAAKDAWNGVYNPPQ